MFVFVHLLNDMSGSPRVLRSVIAALLPGVTGARLYLGSDGGGILDGADIRTERYWYRRTRQRTTTLATYLISQLLLYRRLSRSRDIPSDAIVYVNTLLPFAAAIWGRRTGRRVVYHLHEISITPWLLRKLLTSIAARTADRLIYVSDDHKTRLSIPEVPAAVVANPIDPDLYSRGASTPYVPRRSGQFEVLMLASPRDFKGVPEFVGLAKNLAGRGDIHFTLVLNGETDEVSQYLTSYSLPANLTVHAKTDNPAVFYSLADLVVNLSRPDLCIETFGLTLTEAMAFGVPVIAPPVGGPTEIVRDGIEGFLVDARDSKALAALVTRLADNPALCMRLSEAARARAQDYSWESFAGRLRELLAELQEAKPAR